MSLLKVNQLLIVITTIIHINADRQTGGNTTCTHVHTHAILTRTRIYKL